MRTSSRFLIAAGLCVAVVFLSTGSAASHAQSATATAPVAADPQSTPASAATTAPPGKPAPAALSAQTVADESLANPYGLQALWQQGDVIARLTLLILLLMSLMSWYVITTKFLEQARIGRQAKEIGPDFWAADSVKAVAQRFKPDSPFRYITEKGLEGASRHEGLLGTIDFNTWVTMSIQRAMAKVHSSLQEGLSLLATVGSTAPFVGLFGTVWGIYHALVAIGISGQASIDKVAGPVGESLIMTAIGLAVAVPAVLGYNWLLRRNKMVTEDIQSFGSDLHAVLLATATRI